MSDFLSRSDEGATMSQGGKLDSLLNPPTCPKCGSRMRLARIEPRQTPTPRADEITYDCACGHLHVETVETL